VVVETGAYDQPGPGLKNYVGYYLARTDILFGWSEFLKFISDDLHASVGSNLRTIGGQPVDVNHLYQGIRDNSGVLTGYILNNICQSTSCN
jgi:hypothetical protein